MTESNPLPISVLVLTKNEEKDLPGCLASVSWCDDVHVFDSQSNDRTVLIAEQAGASVTRREFDDWSSHQNWGLRNLAFKYHWVLYIDADERVTPELVESLRIAVERPGANVAFMIRRRDFLDGTWLKHVQATAWYVRLYIPEFISYERLVNPITKVQGETGHLSGFLDHFPFSKGITHWINRHNSYSSLEAQELPNRRIRTSFRKAFFDEDYAVRRAHQKAIYYNLPFRPIIKFLYLYLIKRGFLDGRAGLRYATLILIYEYFILLKEREINSASLSRGI